MRTSLTFSSAYAVGEPTAFKSLSLTTFLGSALYRSGHSCSQDVSLDNINLLGMP